MTVNSLSRFADDVDWFLIRKHPVAWYFWIDFFVLRTLLTAVIFVLSFLLFVLAVGGSLENVAVIIIFITLTYAATTSHIWFYHVFRNSEFVYSGLGLAPILLGTAGVLEPLFVFLPFAGVDTDLLFLNLAFWVMLSFYFHKIVVFLARPRPFKSSTRRRLMFGTLIVGGSLIAACCATYSVLIFVSPSSSHVLSDPNARAAVIKALGAGSEQGEGDQFVAKKNQRALADDWLVDGWLAPYLPRPFGNLGRPGNEQELALHDNYFYVGAAVAVSVIAVIGVWIIGLGGRLVQAWVIGPTVDFRMHRLLVRGRQISVSGSDWNRTFRYSVGMVVAILVIDPCVHYYLTGIWPADLSVIGKLAIALFVFLQARSIQPYFNEYHAIAGIRASHPPPDNRSGFRFSLPVYTLLAGVTLVVMIGLIWSPPR